MALSAFDDTSRGPSDRQVADALGDVNDLWDGLKAEIASRFDPIAEDWTFSGKQWGWSLRLKHKKRAVLYMTPSDGRFFVGFALGEQAVAAAQEAGLPKRLLEIIEGSQKYAEGRAVRLEVTTPAGVEWAVILAEIKMAN
jgi:hypothetical protein